MSGWWIYDYYQAGLTIILVSHLFWVVLSIVLHELAHGWTAVWQGDDTPVRMHRLTLNPLVHMGGWSFVWLLLVGIAWGSMPIDPSRFRWRRRGRAVVAAAGPAMNLLLVLVALLGLALWIRFSRASDPLFSNVAACLFVGAEINVFLAVFNLLPIPPLDGAEILAGLSFRTYRLHQHPNAQIIGFFIVIALMMSGLLSFAWLGASHVAAAGADALGALLGNPSVRDITPF